MYEWEVLKGKKLSENEGKYTLKRWWNDEINTNKALQMLLYTLEKVV